MEGLVKHEKSINELLKRYGVKFGIYKNNEFHENFFPFDTLPRIIETKEFAYLEKGLIQRVNSLNMFLKDIYTKQQIVKDGIIPEEFIYISKGYFHECYNVVPPKGIYSHISGIDLVQAKDHEWYVLEDNLRIPSGASYPMIARELTRRASPMTFINNSIVDNRGYGQMLKEVMDYVNCDGINVILTPGRYNSAYFEHSFLAEKTGAILATPQELVVENNLLFYKNHVGLKIKVGSLYRRISDEYLDPMTFLPESVIGIPNLMAVYRSNNVAIINAPGNGVADDKGIYYFVPKMIEYYLHEQPILKNAPTYLPYFKEDLEYVINNLDKLVIKDVSEAGGYGVVFGANLNQEEQAKLKQLIIDQPRRWIGQEVIDFIDLPVNENGEKVMRKADLRAFVLSGEKTKVWPSGLTRYARNEGSFVVNSSQGGGFKDTWVLSR